jgi:hypothetical protein
MFTNNSLSSSISFVGVFFVHSFFFFLWQNIFSWAFLWWNLPTRGQVLWLEGCMNFHDSLIGDTGLSTHHICGDFVNLKIYCLQYLGDVRWDACTCMHVHFPRRCKWLTCCLVRRIVTQMKKMPKALILRLCGEIYGVVSKTNTSCRMNWNWDETLTLNA